MVYQRKEGSMGNVARRTWYGLATWDGMGGKGVYIVGLKTRGSFVDILKRAYAAHQVLSSGISPRTIASVRGSQRASGKGEG